MFCASRIGDVLVEQGLLPFEQELLVAQRTHRQPRQHQARRQHRHHKDQRDFFHDCRSCNIPIPWSYPRSIYFEFRAL